MSSTRRRTRLTLPAASVMSASGAGCCVCLSNRILTADYYSKNLGEFEITLCYNECNMQYVADFHLHSKYSRAVSKDMILPNMALFGRKKGIDILTVADWTHPLWFREMSEQLEETNEGLYKLKSQSANLKTTTQNSNLGNDLLFILSTEVSSIYSQGGKVRRIHNLLFAPNFETAEKINKELQRRGCNLMADGRPIIGISAKDLLELVLGIDRRVVIVPCHIWTPWFSLYGSNSGFDTIEECFGNYAKHIYGIETGLSSDPEMNWRIPELKTRTILSFSDSHSLAKMAREATILALVKPTYMNVMRALIHPSILKNTVKPGEEEKLRNKIAYSIEFYPEEGKYHYNGHRNCNIVQSPQETKEKGNMCPVCKRSMTIGVMQRVEELAREELTVHSSSFTVDEFGV